MTSRTASLVALAAALALGATACGTDDPSTVSLPPSPSPSAGATDQPTRVASAVPSDAVDQTIAVTVADGKVTGGVRRVKVALGSRLRITVTTDKSDELHVHLYDLRKVLSAGQAGSVELFADRPGVVVVELEQSGTTLVTLQIS